MTKQSLKDRLKKIKINKYKSLFIAGSVALLPSLFKQHQTWQFNLPKKITADIIVIGADTISSQAFYENVKYFPEQKTWKYNHKNRDIDVYYLFDHKNSNLYNEEKLEKQHLVNRYDTAVISYKQKFINVTSKSNPIPNLVNLNFNDLEGKNFYKTPYLSETQEVEKVEPQAKKADDFSLVIKNQVEVMYNKSQESEGLGAKAFYLENENSITMVEYKADPSLPKEKRERLQEILDTRYNREDVLYNYDHEYQHFLNAKSGINGLGMTLEQTYRRRLHDELSANIKQFWKQREAYLQSGCQSNKLTSKTKFYHELIERGLIKPKLGEKISPQEQRYIAEGMQKAWDEKSRPFYQKSTLKYVRNRLKNNPAYKTKGSDEAYEKLLNDIYTYTVDGQTFNLRPYVKEFEINTQDGQELSAMREERGFIENDAISYQKQTKSKADFNRYIATQKTKHAILKHKSR
ncbi:MAG: hypothetical protein PHE89_03260 [Alphaproteobacteria bacterium]|nr:hypothetical protein [Alphaproteobacteria bacterium]